MRKFLFIGAVAAPVLFASSGAFACFGYGYGYAPRHYGYSAPRYYGYSYYAPRWRFIEYGYRGR